MNDKESIQLHKLSIYKGNDNIKNYEAEEKKSSLTFENEYQELCPNLALTKDQAQCRSQKFTILQRIETKPKSFVKNVMHNVDSWNSLNTIISTDYGKDSCLYFKLSRWMASHVFYTVLACLLFLVIPMIIIYYQNTSNASLTPDYISILSLTNENWLINTPIFFGFYNQSHGSDSRSVYSISRAYFWVNILTRLVYVVLLLRKFIFSVSVVYTERYSSSLEKSSLNVRFILGMWDFRLDSKRSIQYCRMNIKDFIRRINSSKTISTQATKNLNIVINVISLTLIGIIFESVSRIIIEDEIFFQKSLPGTISTWQYLRSPMVVSLLVITSTWIFDLLKCIEDYHKEYIEVLISFGRILILNFGISFILMYHWSMLISCAKSNMNSSNLKMCTFLRERFLLSSESLIHTCWETWLGQRILIYMLVNVFLSFGFYISVDILKSILKNCQTSIFRPKFFYTSFIGNLCYMDCLFWLGFYYSPFISFVWFLTIVLLFFYNVNVISVSCFPRCSSSQTISFKRSVFLFMLLLSSLTGIGTFASHSFIFQPSRGCGPFTHLEYNYKSEDFNLVHYFYENNFVKKVLDIGDQILLSDGLWYFAIIIFLSLAFNFSFQVYGLRKIHRLAIMDKIMIHQEKQRAAENCQGLVEKLKVRNSDFHSVLCSEDNEEIIKEFTKFEL